MVNQHKEGKDYIPFIINYGPVSSEYHSALDPKKTPLLKKQLASLERGSPPLEPNHYGVSGTLKVGNVFFSKCYNCDQVSIWHSDQMLYPIVDHEISMSEDMPVEIRDDFEEARAIVKKSPRGAAALLRLCIEKLCKHLGCTGDLNNMIGQLVKRGLNEKIQKALDTVRVIGGQAVHPLQMDLKDDEATAMTLFRIINIIVEQLITEERKINEMYSVLPERQLDAIKKRDTK